MDFSFMGKKEKRRVSPCFIHSTQTDCLFCHWITGHMFNCLLTNVCCAMSNCSNFLPKIGPVNPSVKQPRNCLINTGMAEGFEAPYGLRTSTGVETILFHLHIYIFKSKKVLSSQVMLQNHYIIVRENI